MLHLLDHSTKGKAMGITNQDVARFVALAGDGFAWAGVRGSSRPASDVRKALRDDLWERQGRVCAACGMGDTGDALEFNHVVSRGPAVKGFVAGNIFTGHATCNARTKPLYDTDGSLMSGVEVLTSEHLTRMDVVPTDWTPFPILRQRRK